MPGNGQDKLVHAAEVVSQARKRGHIDHSDIAALRQTHTDDELEQVLTWHYATDEGRQEMAKAGMGGREPREVARILVRGR